VSRTITPADIRKSFTVRATPEKAFAVFTEGFDRWWPRSHSIGDAPLKRATIEPKAGDRWYSLTEDGVEHEWGEVLAWRLNADFAYDPSLLTEVEVRFADAGAGETRVDFEHRGLERLGAGDAANRVRSGMDAGWATILDSFQSAASG